MDTYKSYLAARILTEDRIVGSQLFNDQLFPVTKSVPGDLPPAQSSAQSACEYSKAASLPNLTLSLQLLIVVRMLYEFHRIQNGKKPGSVHATYLLSGTKREEARATNGEAKDDDEDVHMQSSPFMSSSMPQPEETAPAVPILSITLVREEDLEGEAISQPMDGRMLTSQSDVREKFTELFCIHVYSLGPSPLKVNKVAV